MYDRPCAVNNWSRAIIWLNMFLSVLIVLLHTNVETSDLLYLHVKQTIDVFADVAVPAFFFVSAYLLFRKDRHDNYVRYLWKKVMSLLLPYLLWNVAGYIYSILLQCLMHKQALPFSLLNLLTCKYNAPLWFLRTLFGFVLLFPIVSFLLRKKQCAAIVTVVIFGVNIFLPPAYTSLRFWTPVYLSGALCATHYKYIFESDDLLFKKWYPAVKLGIIASVISCVAWGFFTYETRWYYVYRIMGGIAIVLFFGLFSGTKYLRRCCKIHFSYFVCTAW